MTAPAVETERDDFAKWADALEGWVMTGPGARIVCYDDLLATPALDATEFVLKLIAAYRKVKGE